MPSWLRLSTTEGQAATGWLRAFSTVARDAPTRYVGTGHGRGAMVVAHGGIWVANRRSRSMVRVDPDTLEVTSAQRLRKMPIAVAAGPESVWAFGSNGWLWRIRPDDGRAEGIARLGRGATSVAAAGGLVWALRRNGRLDGLELASGEIMASTRVPGRAFHAAGSATALWVSCRGGRRLVRVDPRSGLVEAEIELPNRASCLAAGDDGVLVGSAPCFRSARGWLHTIDWQGRQVASTVELSSRPRAIAAADGAAWIACSGKWSREGVIERVDLEAGRAAPWVETGWAVSDLAVSGDVLLASMSLVTPVPVLGPGYYGGGFGGDGGGGGGN